MEQRDEQRDEGGRLPEQALEAGQRALRRPDVEQREVLGRPAGLGQQPGHLEGDQTAEAEPGQAERSVRLEAPAARRRARRRSPGRSSPARRRRSANPRCRGRSTGCRGARTAPGTRPRRRRRRARGTAAARTRRRAASPGSPRRPAPVGAAPRRGPPPSARPGRRPPAPAAAARCAAGGGSSSTGGTCRRGRRSSPWGRCRRTPRTSRNTFDTAVVTTSPSRARRPRAAAGRCSAARTASRIASRLPGFFSAARLRTGAPLTASRAARSDRLPLWVAGSSATGDDDLRDVGGGALGAQRAADPRGRARRRTARPGAQHDQQHQPGAAVGRAARRPCASATSGMRPQDAVDLRRADPDAVDVQHAVGAAVHAGPTRPARSSIMSPWVHTPGWSAK